MLTGGFAASGSSAPKSPSKKKAAAAASAADPNAFLAVGAAVDKTNKDKTQPGKLLASAWGMDSLVQDYTAASTAAGGFPKKKDDKK